MFDTIGKILSGVLWSVIAAPAIIPITIVLFSSTDRHGPFVATDRYLWVFSLPVGVFTYVGIYLLSLVWTGVAAQIFGGLFLIQAVIGFGWGLLLSLKNH